MENKYVNYVIWALLILIVLGVLWLLIEPIIWWTQYSEIRLYIRIFLLMFAASTFALLRLYNSIVQNTRFSIKLREAFVKLTNFVPSVERNMKTLNGTLNSVRTSNDSLKKEMADNTDKITKLTDKIHRSNNFKN